MTTYRNFIRGSATGFDGTTPEDAEYSQLGFVWTTPSTDVVGLFAPESLRRFNTVSLIRVGLDVVALGDLVRVVDESGNQRSATPATTAGEFLFFFPRDRLAIAAAAAREANILVHDLDDDAMQQFIAGGGGGGGGGPPNPYGYNHVQAVPAALWVVMHNLGFLPVVEARNPAGVVVTVDVTHVDVNTCLVGPFFVPLAGTARCA